MNLDDENTNYRRVPKIYVKSIVGLRWRTKITGGITRERRETEGDPNDEVTRESRSVSRKKTRSQRFEQGRSPGEVLED